MASIRDHGRILAKTTLSLLLAGTPLVSGCGSSETVELSAKITPLHPVTGKVVGVGSSPIAGAKISFIPKDIASGGRVATGELKADGAFELTTETPGDGISEGTYKIKLDPPPSKPGVNARNTAIPSHYQDEDGSGLTQTITATTTTLPPIKLSAVPKAGVSGGRRPRLTPFSARHFPLRSRNDVSASWPDDGVRRSAGYLSPATLIRKANLNGPQFRPAPWFYAHRTVGGDRHHRRAHLAVAARRAGRPRSRPPHPVRQQPEANRPRPSQLRERPGRLPVLRRVDQLLDHPAEHSVRRRRLRPPAPPSELHRRQHDLQHDQLQLRIQPQQSRKRHGLHDRDERLPLPEHVRTGGQGREGSSSQADTEGNAFGGYGVGDYAATCYTDIDPAGVAVRAGTATPYRNKAARINGLLKQGSTRIAEITDGTSNTIAFAEDAGRDPSFQSPYSRGTAPALVGIQAGFPAGAFPYAPTDAGLSLRYWRWAEADGAFGVSGGINNKFRPMKCAAPWQAAGCQVNGITVQGNNAGANDEIFSFHPGGANVLMGDGSVKFLKESMNVVVLRSLVSLAGGEVVSADAY